jgi:hypothetical protein
MKRQTIIKMRFLAATSTVIAVKILHALYSALASVRHRIVVTALHTCVSFRIAELVPHNHI